MKSTMIVILALVLALDHFNVVFGEPRRIVKYPWHKKRRETRDTQVNTQEKLSSIAIFNFTSYTIRTLVKDVSML